MQIFKAYILTLVGKDKLHVCCAVFCSFPAEQSKKGGVLSPKPERYAHGCGQIDGPLPPEI